MSLYTKCPTIIANQFIFTFQMQEVRDNGECYLNENNHSGYLQYIDLVWRTDNQHDMPTELPEVMDGNEGHAG